MQKGELLRDGYFHVKGLNTAAFESLVQELGEVIHRTSVVVNLTSRALVMSDEALDLHTDHQRARYIAWHCIKQTDQGGSSLLLDVGALFDLLNKDEQLRLAEIRFATHRVFDGDVDEQAFLTAGGEARRFYYAPFLVLPQYRDDPLLLRFRQLVREATPSQIHLQDGDVLIVDNHRILHGRTAIFGSKDRRLERCWIQ